MGTQAAAAVELQVPQVLLLQHASHPRPCWLAVFPRSTHPPPAALCKMAQPLPRTEGFQTLCIHETFILLNGFGAPFEKYFLGSQPVYRQPWRCLVECRLQGATQPKAWRGSPAASAALAQRTGDKNHHKLE